MYSKISETPIFKGINPGEVVHILNLVHHQIKTYEPETIIAYSGDECINLYILIEGSVRGEVVGLKGKIIKIEDINAPDTFAEAFLFADENNLLVNIVTNTKTKILIIYKNDLLQLFKSNKKILENYLNITSNRFVLITKKLKLLSLKTIKGKLANYILSLERKNEGKQHFLIDKTQEQLAEYFGVTRPSLARALGEMKDEGLIEIKWKEIKILDRNSLVQMLK
ncbi:MAG: Crp/Fnr family transcriptional regulator [Bacteroidales bacterium]|nr:Crp/Fnr family transcriptional regulator [Bacteroidales bacterium]MCK4638741.1 Crp/Fnr family transcriptional regulator [Bacteroidales bacterium]